jgi:hypothetical protein
MDDIETLIGALHTLNARLETLRHMEGPDLVLPDSIEQYRSTLEDAYAAYGKIETIVDELGQELEYQHRRLDKEAQKDDQA